MKARYFSVQIICFRLLWPSLLTVLLLAGCQVLFQGTDKARQPDQDTSARHSVGSDRWALADTPGLTLLVTNSKGDYISFIEPSKGTVDEVKVGIAPFGLALGPGNRAYVATAEGIAVVDTKQRKKITLVPYQEDVGNPEYGEYRPGGMGIAASPDGRWVYVGVYLKDQPSQLQILDTERLIIVGSVPVGDRPFQVLVSPNGKEVYSIDHDSYSVTVVDPKKLSARTLEVAPLGKSAFDKPHYAAIRKDGYLLLPIRGRSLVILDPKSGKYTTTPLSSDTHQHGVNLTKEGNLFIVGTGPAGRADGEPTLTILNINTMSEKNIPLDQVHENVAVSSDGQWAYLTGGFTYADGGWDGLTIVDLQKGVMKQFAIPDRPQDIAILP